jgi:phosphoserine phosphatase RsbU/P
MRDTLADLIGAVSVVLVAATILVRSRMYADIIEKRMTWRQRAGIIFLFGLFSVYGTNRGVQMLGAVVSISDLGPVIAGLIGGPLVGLATGLFGAVYRYSQGGFAALSYSLSTLLAGLLGGLYYWWSGGSFPGVRMAMLFMVGVELFHQGLILLIARPFNQALRFVEAGVIPMVAAGAVGIGLFAFMVRNLKHEKATESAKHMMEGELKAARDIQMGILPRTFSPFPQRTEFDLFAMIQPAREVGGDFYDFFFIDEDRLCFVIGDVSGKGVPASLFMAVAKTLIKASALSGLRPDQVLGAVNDELSRENDSTMFVTVFCATLDTRTGEIIYANGGHNPPYLVPTGGGMSSLTTEADPIVGAIAGISYKSQSIKLQPDDEIFLYTDGVSEAMNKDQSFFTTERLESSLTSAAGLPLKDAVGKVLADVTTFCSGAEQSDDITMMAIRYRGAEKLSISCPDG